MSKIEVMYEGQTSTCCIKADSGVQIKTDLQEEFSPIDLFAASLGACFMTLVSLTAKKLSLDITGSRIEVTKEMSNNPRRVSKMEVHFFCPRRFSEEMEEQLEKAGNTCPIHYSLHPDLVQEFTLHWGAS